MSNWQFFGLVAALMALASALAPDHKDAAFGFLAGAFTVTAVAVALL